MDELIKRLKTYVVRYLCWNCGKYSTVRLSKGVEAASTGECPNCGCYSVHHRTSRRQRGDLRDALCVRLVLGMGNEVMQKVFALVWRNWLDPDDRVVRVKGWRTALIEKPNGRRFTVQFCPILTWRNKRK